MKNIISERGMFYIITYLAVSALIWMAIGISIYSAGKHYEKEKKEF